MQSDSDQLQGTSALKFIQLQLLELARDCDSVVHNGLVSSQYFMQLQNKLEKILYETRMVISPPPRQPAMEDFKTVKYINSGAFGTVNLVRHRETGQALALKQIKRQSLISERDVQQLLVEHNILTFTDNPFVVAMYCSFKTGRDLCMVMEYVEGGDCNTLLQRFGRFPVDMAQMYMAEIVCGVEYIHSFGILHRDLKPSNLLITSRGHIKITDFGLSKIGSLSMAAEGCAEDIANEFTDGEIAGTPIYFAPELHQGEAYGKPVDWWAVGVILYQFLVGSFPFDGENDDELRNEVINKNVTWPEERDVVPYEAQVIIILLLTKNSIQRLGTRGASEVKAQPFFQDVDFDNLTSQRPRFVPQLEDEEDTSNFGAQSDSSYKSNNDCKLSVKQKFTYMVSGFDRSFTESELAKVNIFINEENVFDYPGEAPVEVPYFSSVAFRFREVYGDPEPLSPAILLIGYEEEGPEDTVDTEDPEGIMDTENSDESEDTKDPEDTKDNKDSKDSKDTEDTEDPEDPEDTKDTEDPEDREGPEDTVDTEDPEGIMDTENSDESKDPEDPEDTEETKDTKDPEDNKDTQDTQDTQDPEDPEDTEEPEDNKDNQDTQDTQDTQDPEDPEDTEEPEDNEDTEDTEDTKDTEDPEDTKEPEGPQDYKDSEEPENTEEPQEPQDPEDSLRVPTPSDLTKNCKAKLRRIPPPSFPHLYPILPPFLPHLSPIPQPSLPHLYPILPPFLPHLSPIPQPSLPHF